jgi:cyclic pyranopterin phosphate synthase
MVDISAKAVTDRSARARAIVRMQAGTAKALREATLPKGDAMVAAQLAGIMAAKQTSNLIPLTHPLQLAQVEVSFAWHDDTHLQIDARVATTGQTGVEMEAMTAACVAALTIYDMTKALERGIVIESVQLVEKLGGKSGTWHAPE